VVTDAGPGRIASAPGGRRWWVWLLVLSVLAVGVYRHRATSRQHTAAGSPASGPPRPAVSVAVATARQGDMPVYLTGLGSVAAYNTVAVKSRVDGQLINVAFREGQLVHEGDLLAEIDPRPFQVQLEQAQGQMARDKAQLEDARLTLARFRELRAEKVVSQQEFDDQAARFAQFTGAIQADQAAIDSAQLQLTYSRITAPITGRTGLRLVDAGNMVHANEQNPMVVITQHQPITALFTIPEDELPPVIKKLGAGEQLRAEAYDRADQNQIASGSLLSTDNQIDPNTGTLRLKAVFENTDGALFPNQFVNVHLLLDVKRGTVIAPVAAIQRGARGTFVYVVKPDHTVEMRPVTLGPTGRTEVAVESGLAAGEVVVVEGADKLREGSPVQVRGAEREGTGPKPGG
jgi:multidrug efflux system membrane fusion protein